jgi:ribosome recycling factor
MPYNFTTFKQQTKDVEAWLSRELATVRSGRASPALLDNVLVESYGSKLPLKHLGSIGIEDPRTLKVSLWDKEQLKLAEAALLAANLGVSVVADSSGLRVMFPQLTSEKRQLLIKLVHDKLEAAKITLRQEREKTWNDIQEQAKEGTLSEDEKFKYKDELQALVDAGNKALAAVAAHKEEELNQ